MFYYSLSDEDLPITSYTDDLYVLTPQEEANATHSGDNY